MSNGPATPEIDTPDRIAEGFGTRELSVQRETAATAVAAQAQAAIQARWIIAQRNPRDWDDVRVRLLKECKRPSFAKVARYRKPIGKGIEGPSIRFAEAAIRAMTNIFPETAVLFDDRMKRVLRITVTDLESNTAYSQDVVFEKTIERHKLPPNEKPLGIRTNSQGQTVYILQGTDDDVLNKQNALISKAIRTSGLRLLPGDILDECMELVKETVRKGITEDPDAERKRLADAFAALNIPPSEIKRYLGCDLGQASPAQLDELRALYTAIRDGEATWREAMDARDVDPEPEGGGNGGGTAQGSELGAKVAEAQAKLKKSEGAPTVGEQAPKDAGSPESEAENTTAGTSAPDGGAPAPDDPNRKLTDDERIQFRTAIRERAIEVRGDKATQEYEDQLAKTALAMQFCRTIDQMRYAKFALLMESVPKLA